MKFRAAGKGMLALAAATALLSAGVYIVPKEYDNTYNSIKSRAIVLIYNGLTTLSSVTKNFAGKSVKYKCMTIDKIQCRAGSPAASVSVNDISLMDPSTDRLLPVYAEEVIAESAGDKWNICGAAIGGVMWDTSELSTKDNGDGTQSLVYTYTPNTNGIFYYFFTDQPDHGSDKSFMVVNVQQKCI